MSIKLVRTPCRRRGFRRVCVVILIDADRFGRVGQQVVRSGRCPLARARPQFFRSLYASIDLPFWDETKGNQSKLFRFRCPVYVSRSFFSKRRVRFFHESKKIGTERRGTIKMS